MLIGYMVQAVTREHELDEDHDHAHDVDHDHRAGLEVGVVRRLEEYDSGIGSMNENSAETMSTFEDQFVSEFTNNGASNDQLVDMSRTEDTQAIMRLDKRKIWIVGTTMMSTEQFSIMRFMCKNLNEFVNLIMYSSLNEIKQVYTTLDKRANIHKNLLPDSIMSMPINSHPGVYMAEYCIHETNMAAELYTYFINRMVRYVNMTIKVPGIMQINEDEIETSINNKCLNSCEHTTMKMSRSRACCASTSRLSPGSRTRGSPSRSSRT